MDYEEISLDALKNVVHNDIALILTATDVESEALHKKLKPLNGFSTILQSYEDSNSYYAGVLGNYQVVHVQSQMGAIGRDSAITTISSALNTLNPKFVLMVGIAFGIDEKKQNIGDVLVAEGVIPYDIKRVGEKTIQRGLHGNSSRILFNRFKSVKTWQHLLSDSIPAKKILTHVLSGEELIDNKPRRDELAAKYPSSKGGEMEGAGLFAACDGKVDWILVKGICDFADGNKSVNKPENQRIAINSALSLCIELFNSNHAFKALGLLPAVKELELKPDNKVVDNVLFDIYDETKENYYIARTEDDSFTNVLKQYCIWIHGVSGCGKTNLILRNLTINKTRFTTISLASCINVDVNDLFKEVLFDLEAKFEKLKEPLINNSFSNICRNILSVLDNFCYDEEHFVFIEEIPIASDNDYEEFVSHFFSFLILKKLKPGLNKVKFVLSSIKDPSKHIKQTQIKIHQQVKFIKLENWHDEDIDMLISMIIKELEIRISIEITTELKVKSQNSPRFIKKYFRNLLAYNISGSDTEKIVLDETDRELNQFNHAQKA